MGRKKKREGPIIFCYYCDRIFENERVLILHQQAKHFHCPSCNRKYSTAQGMHLHAFQVHQLTVDVVPGAKDGRNCFDNEIFGMDGVPQELIDAMRVKVFGENSIKKVKPNPQFSVPLQNQTPGMLRNCWQQTGMIPVGLPVRQPRIIQIRMPTGRRQGMPMAHLPPRLVMGHPGVVMPQMVHNNPGVLHLPRMVMQHPGIVARQNPPTLLRGTTTPPKLIRAPGGPTFPQQARPAPNRLLVPMSTPFTPLLQPPRALPPQSGLPSFAQPLPSTDGLTPMQVPPIQQLQTIARDKKKKKDVVIMYADKTSSQEEKRAMHPKYSGYLNKRISSLNESIDARMDTLLSS